MYLNGDATISNEQKDGLHLEFDISKAKANTVLELPYLYYLGYDKMKRYQALNLIMGLFLYKFRKI